MKATLPTLAAGELGFCTDTYEVYVGDGSANHKLAPYTVLDLILNRGVLSGLVVTDVGGLGITWTDGSIFDRVTGGLVSITAQATPVSCSDNSINYLKWVSGTTLTLSTTPPSGDELFVARIDTFNNDIYVINHVTYLNTAVASLRRAVRDMFPLLVTSGLIVSEKSGSGVWDVVSSAGAYVEDGQDTVDVPAIDSTVTSIVRIFHSAGVWTLDTNAQIDPTKYDNGTDLAATTANKYYKSLFLIGHNTIHWIYPQVEYNTEAQAIAAPLPSIPAGVVMHPKSIAIVLKGDATAFPTAGGQAWIDVRPRIGGNVSGTVTDHGSLMGLTDADHVASSIAFTDTSKILGRSTAGGGAGEEVTCTAFARSILDDTNEADFKATVNLEANTDFYVPGGTDVPIVDGGTGQSTAQLAINALTAVAAATNEHVLTKDTTTGNAIFKASVGGGGGATKVVTQNAHGFAIQDVLYHNGTIYAKAKADTKITAEVVGIVSAVADVNNFTLLNVGYVSSLSGLIAGTVYFLSDTTAGVLTATEPTIEGSVSKPLLIADSATSGYFFNMRGAEITDSTTSYFVAFTNNSLSSGILTVTHNLGHKYVTVQVYDDSDKLIVPDEVILSSTSVLSINLTSYGAISGTWHVVVLDIGTTASQSNTFDHIEEFTSGHGVVVDGVAIKDGGITNQLGLRNAIINGGMDIWQRGTTTLINPANGTYFPDRFVNGHSLGDGTYDLLNSSETPTVGFPFQNSFKLDCTHIETAVAAGEWTGLIYRMEGYDFKRFEGEIATLSFWVKAIKTGTYCVFFTNSAYNKSYVVEYTVNSASTWEKKTVTLTFNSGGTFLYTTGIGLTIGWMIMCGSTCQTSANAWQSGNYFATSNQVNGLDNTANNFWLTGVQLELGSVATPFEVRPFAQELALCQRYFEKSYNYGGGWWTSDNIGKFAFTSRKADQLDYITVFYKVAKRLAPTIVIYQWNTLETGHMRNDSSGASVACNAGSIGETSFVVNPTENTTADVYYGFQWTSAIEL